MIFTGCGTALVTPFLNNGSVDEPTLRALVRRQIDSGINFLVPCGTTGESPTLSHEEHLRVVEVVVKETAKRVPVLAGAGGYDTANIVKLSKEVESVGADGLLSVTPYYNKPTQEGLFQHYRAIAAGTKLPIIVYSVQARTGVNVEPATLRRLSEIDNIVGVKEASGNIGQIASVINQVPEGFAVLSGDDAITLGVIGLGGHGLISVASNVIPAEMTQLVQAALRGDFRTAQLVQRRYQRLMEVNFIESNPIPVKAAMAMMGLLTSTMRLPLVEPAETSRQKIRQVLRESGVLND